MSKPTVDRYLECQRRHLLSRSNFLRPIVQADLDSGKHTQHRHPFPARAQRLPAHRSRQVDLRELRPGPGIRWRTAACVSMTPTRPRRTRSTSTRSRATSSGWASNGPVEVRYASQVLRPVARLGRVELIKAGKAYGRRPDPEQATRIPWQPDRAGQEQPVPRPFGGRKPGPVRTHEGRRVPGRRACAACQDRHGLAEHEPARPDHVSHPPRPSPPDR